MKRTIIYLTTLFVLSIAFASSCGNDLNRVVRKKHKNGQPKTVVYYDGEAAKENMVKLEMFYENGDQKNIIRFKKGVKHGLSKSWHKNGKVWAETNYIDGKKQGESFTTFPNGQIKYEGKYKNTRRVEKWIMYNKNGDTIKVEIYDKDGRLKDVVVHNK